MDVEVIQTAALLFCAACDWAAQRIAWGHCDTPVCKRLQVQNLKSETLSLTGGRMLLLVCFALPQLPLPIRRRKALPNSPRVQRCVRPHNKAESLLTRPIRERVFFLWFQPITWRTKCVAVIQMASEQRKSLLWRPSGGAVYVRENRWGFPPAAITVIAHSAPAPAYQGPRVAMWAVTTVTRQRHVL